ncbi:MAG TPA: ribbon-helix-helix domain-containing protein [Terriglobales bacterium]|nr:ribbon-helix-helix domain-containing protein [Terriglobales bacterium]
MTVGLKRGKLVTDVAAATVMAIRALSRREGSTVQSLIEEALRDLLARRTQPRAHVLKAYRSSRSRYASLYKRLAR